MALLVGCAAPMVAARTHIGECVMPADVDRHTLIGCSSFKPKYTEASCLYLDLDHTDTPYVMTLRTDQCGPWEKVYDGPFDLQPRARPDNRL